MECKNHQGVEVADSCAECLGDFCGDCLVEIQGEQFCHQCNTVMIQEDAKITCEEASSALKIAIIGIILAGVVLEPIAIVKAFKAKRMINEDNRLSGEGKANAAIVIGIVYLAFLILISLLVYINNLR